MSNVIPFHRKQQKKLAACATDYTVGDGFVCSRPRQDQAGGPTVTLTTNTDISILVTPFGQMDLVVTENFGEVFGMEHVRQVLGEQYKWFSVEHFGPGRELFAFYPDPKWHPYELWNWVATSLVGESIYGPCWVLSSDLMPPHPVDDGPQAA